MANISIADVVHHEALPIDSQDIVTKVRLVVAGTRAGPVEPAEDSARTIDGSTETFVTPFPQPVVYEYEDALHATYGSVRSFALPEGISPFLEPTDATIPEPTALNITNAGSPSAVRDGDPVTYAEYAGSSQAALTYSLGDSSIGRLCVGFRIRYALTGVGNALSSEINRRVYMQQWHYTPAPDLAPRVLAQRRFTLTATESLSDPREFYAVTLWDARGADENSGASWIRPSLVRAEIVPFDTIAWRVFEFYPLLLDEALLLEVAKANIKLPAVTPKRVTVDGVVDPLATSHTIVGWPGGDYTGDVARQTYRDGVTIIDFEQAGAPFDRDGLPLPQDAVEAERVRVARTRASIETAGYGLKMGERQ